MFHTKNITIPLLLTTLLSACTKEIAGDVKLTDFQTIPSQILVCAETHRQYGEMFEAAIEYKLDDLDFLEQNAEQNKQYAKVFRGIFDGYDQIEKENAEEETEEYTSIIKKRRPEEIVAMSQNCLWLLVSMTPS
ncbi:hypothetical protein HUF18_00880 [Thalassolituus sp. ST750PaO-4]|uniref:hypothetical protein n=1 Tax=Thalassolituus sp. ST750PaO-4 TaxID=2742965 RepID=UPI001CE315F0|nr:hypothetical protein [Thalassolituus sp. ST750PaO-4]MCA6058314.1 hypothetical protein [Thalassolituus sp. ST750PaO-4]